MRRGRGRQCVPPAPPLATTATPLLVVALQLSQPREPHLLLLPLIVVIVVLEVSVVARSDSTATCIYIYIAAAALVAVARGDSTATCIYITTAALVAAFLAALLAPLLPPLLAAALAAALDALPAWGLALDDDAPLEALWARVLGHLLDIHGALRAMVRHTPGVITSVHMG